MNSVISNSPKQIEALLQAGINPNSADNNQQTPLMQASMLGHVELVELLLAYNADPNIQNIAGSTALHLAIRQNNPDIVKLLIATNARVDLLDFQNFSAIHRALKGKNSEIFANILASEQAQNLIYKDDLNFFKYSLSVKNYAATELIIDNHPNAGLEELNILLKIVKQYPEANLTNKLEQQITALKALQQKKNLAFSFGKENVLEKTQIIEVANFPCINHDAQIKINDGLCLKNNNIITSSLKTTPKEIIIEPKTIAVSKTTNLAQQDNPPATKETQEAKTDIVSITETEAAAAAETNKEQSIAESEEQIIAEQSAAAAFNPFASKTILNDPNFQQSETASSKLPTTQDSFNIANSANPSPAGNIPAASNVIKKTSKSIAAIPFNILEKKDKNEIAEEAKPEFKNDHFAIPSRANQAADITTNDQDSLEASDAIIATKTSKQDTDFKAVFKEEKATLNLEKIRETNLVKKLLILAYIPRENPSITLAHLENELPKAKPQKSYNANISANILTKQTKLGLSEILGWKIKIAQPKAKPYPYRYDQEKALLGLLLTTQKERQKQQEELNMLSHIMPNVQANITAEHNLQKKLSSFVVSEKPQSQQSTDLNYQTISETVAVATYQPQEIAIPTSKPESVKIATISLATISSANNVENITNQAPVNTQNIIVTDAEAEKSLISDIIANEDSSNTATATELIETEAIAINAANEVIIAEEEILAPEIPIKREEENSYEINQAALATENPTLSVRTNEWQLDPYNVPISILDRDSLGYDKVHNRKFTYEQNQLPKKRKNISNDDSLKSKSMFNEVAEELASPAPQIHQKPQKAKAKPGKYYIQLGIFSKYKNAQNLAKEAKKYGTSSLKPFGKNLTKVILGNFTSAAEAKKLQTSQEFIATFGRKTIIKKY